MEMAVIWRVFAATAGPAAVSALWQGAALALGLALCLRLTPRMPAADRFRVWAAGFAALVALPFLPRLVSLLPSVFSAEAATPGASPSGPVFAPVHPWLALDPRWGLAIAAVWLAASLARGVDLGVQAVRLGRLWKRAVPLAVGGFENPSEAKALKLSRGNSARLKPCPDTESIRLSARLKPGDFKAASCGAEQNDFKLEKILRALSPNVEVCTTRDLDRPSVIGFFRPRILIPEWLPGRLSPAELEQVVLHEAEHLRRRDDWMNLVQKLCLVVFPLNPALQWMERRLCREREMACDEGVVRRTRSPRAYAACLTSLAERGLAHRAEALSLGAWRRRPELARRVHQILRRAPDLHPAATRALVGVVGCGLVLGSVELARCPQLVEFAARPAQANLAARHGAARMVNTAYVADGQAMSGFRAVDAVAHVASRAELAAVRRAQERVELRKDEGRWSPTLATGGQAAGPSAPLRSAQNDSKYEALSIPPKSERPRIAASTVAENATLAIDTSVAAGPRQWIVFTAWEQVETTNSSPASGANRAAAARRVVRQYTVTRLILRVDPTGGLGNVENAAATGTTKPDAAKAAPAQNKISITPLPPAIPLRDGWLVIEL